MMMINNRKYPPQYGLIEMNLKVLYSRQINIKYKARTN